MIGLTERRENNNLFAEFDIAVEGFTSAHADLLVEYYGVPSDAWLAAPRSAIGAMRIMTYGDGTWQPDELGRLHLIVVTNLMVVGGGHLIACDERGEPVYDGPPGELEFEDLLAFRPEQPERWWCRLGIARWLGGYELARRAVGVMNWVVEPDLAPDIHNTAEPLQLHRTPLSWLRSNCQGAVPLTQCAVHDLYQIEAPVAVEDVAHGQALCKAMLRPLPPIPRILVRNPVGTKSAEG